ncbi:hypothetical protein AKG09_02045 [Neisseria sp. 83E34]|nr:hypothetical protein AKG09_02045 [Neisseria sp. 83E34]
MQLFIIEKGQYEVDVENPNIVYTFVFCLKIHLGIVEGCQEYRKAREAASFLRMLKNHETIISAQNKSHLA